MEQGSGGLQLGLQPRPQNRRKIGGCQRGFNRTDPCLKTKQKRTKLDKRWLVQTKVPESVAARQSRSRQHAVGLCLPVVCLGVCTRV